MEPLVYFSVLHNPITKVLDFAEYDAEIDNPYMGTYHFAELSSGCNRIQTIWYDFLSRSYYYSNISLERANDIINEESYIDISYILGVTLLIWVICPTKSKLIMSSCISTNRIKIEIETNDEWVKNKERVQHEYDLNKEKEEKLIKLMNIYTKRLVCQYIYRYLPTYENWDEEKGEWQKYSGGELVPTIDFDFIEEILYDGTHDKLHDGGLMKYHQAGKPKKLHIKWHMGKSEYSAYFWFEDERIREVFDRFYGAHPDTKTDFIIRIDAEKRKYELALYRYGLKEPQVIPDDVYQLLVFKNQFEDYRSENYNQERGAWIW